MFPLVLVALVVGGFVWYRRNQQQTQPSALPMSGTSGPWRWEIHFVPESTELPYNWFIYYGNNSNYEDSDWEKDYNTARAVVATRIEQLKGSV